MFKRPLQIALLCLIGHCCWASDESAKFALTTKWVSFAGGSVDPDAVYALSVDASTNLYFGGVLGAGFFSYSQDPVVQQNHFLSVGAGSDSAYVAKSDKDGTLLWVSTWSYGEGYDRYPSTTHGLTSVDGALYVASVAENRAYVEEIDDWVPWDEAILFKLNTTNGTNIWCATLSSLSGGNHYNTTNAFKAVAVDEVSGDVYVVGYTTMTNLSSSTSLSGGKDAIVVKYNAAGSNLWVRYLGGPNNDEANAVSIGPEGLYVSGTTQSSGTNWITRGDSTLPKLSNRCGFLSKIDFNGTNVFFTQVLGGSTNDEIFAMQSVSNTIYLAGKTASTNFCAVTNQLNTLGGSTDGFVLKLTDVGTTCQTNWFRYIGTNTADAVYALTLMDSNRVVVSGSTGAGGWLPESDEISRPYSGGIDGFILQLDRDSGAPKWSTYLGGTSNETAYALVASGTSLFVGGSTGYPDLEWEMFGGFQDSWSAVRNIEGLYSETGFVGRWSQEPGVPPIIANTNDISDVTVHEGDTVEFIVYAQSMPAAKYYWLTNGVPVGGVSTNRYVIASALPSDNNTTYQCIASNVFGSVMSHEAHLTVIANGFLNISLSPPSAVVDGAAWQLTSGVWRASGTIALYPGTNTVAFSNLTHVGWTTPLTRDVVVVSSQTTTVTAVYTAPVATAVRTVTSWTNVSLAVTCPPSVTNWTVVESLPPYVTPTNYFSGVWNGTTRTLTYTGSGVSTLTYTTRISTNGDFAISGVITSMPINVTMSTGTNNVSRGDFLRTIVGTNISIYMFAPATTNIKWTLNEKLPLSLQPFDISDNIFEGLYEFNGLMNLEWSERASAVGRVLMYSVSAVPGVYQVSGSCTIAGFSYNIFGDSVVIIPEPPPEPPPPPTILSFAFNGTTASLTFTSVVSQAYMYMVVTNANLAVTNGWNNCLPAPVPGELGSTTVVVPVVNPQLFYRVKVE